MKKGLAIFLVLSLLASMLVPVPVLGTNGLPGGVTVTGGATVVSYETHGDSLSGVLPTGVNLDFIIDPDGLLGLTAGDSVADATESNVVDFSGGVSYGDVLRAWNTSTVPVVLSVELALEATVADAAGIALWVQPNAVAQTAGDTFSGLVDRVVTYGRDGETVLFLLDQVAHEIIVDGPLDPLTGVIPTIRRRVSGTPAQHGTALRFAGIIDPEHDWDAAGDLGVRAVFSLEEASAEAVAAKATVSATVPYGWLNAFGTYVPPALVPIPTTVVPAGPTIGFGTPDANGFVRVSATAATLNMSLTTANAPVYIPLVIPTGATVEVRNSAGAVQGSDRWTMSGTALRLSTTRANAYRGWATGTTTTHTIAVSYQGETTTLALTISRP